MKTARTRKRVEKILASYGCEMWGTESLTAGLGRLTDGEAKKVWQALVKAAAKHGLTIWDPQAGMQVDLGSAGALPPGWSAASVMDAAAFHMVVHGRLREPLSALGYGLAQFGFQRVVDGHLRQQIGFGLDGERCMAFVDWQFLFDGIDPGWPNPIAMVDYVASSPLGEQWPTPMNRPLWGRLPATLGAMESSLVMFERAVVEVVHPLFESVATVHDLVAGFEDGRLGSVATHIKNAGEPHEAINVAFGYGSATFANMAAAYRHLGRLADGRKRVMDYLDHVSGGNRSRVRELVEEAEALFGE